MDPLDGLRRVFGTDDDELTSCAASQCRGPALSNLDAQAMKFREWLDAPDFDRDRASADWEYRQS